MHIIHYIYCILILIILKSNKTGEYVADANQNISEIEYGRLSGRKEERDYEDELTRTDEMEEIRVHDQLFTDMFGSTKAVEVFEELVTYAT